MPSSSVCLPVLALLALVSLTNAGEVTLRSGPARTHLLELYTSEGCSSCPPAERWLSTLRQSPRLWKDVVPLAFHVDYWDGLGWKDDLASPASTARQRRYAAAWDRGTVYTPGFVLDGREWQERDWTSIPAPDANAGTLAATVRDDGQVLVAFQAAGTDAGAWEAHAALLGFGLKSEVRGGENRGRTLVHDFAVLAHEVTAMRRQHGEIRAAIRLPVHRESPEPFAVAVWVTEAGKLAPVQAAGGVLPSMP